MTDREERARAAQELISRVVIDREKAILRMAAGEKILFFYGDLNLVLFRITASIATMSAKVAANDRTRKRIWIVTYAELTNIPPFDLGAAAYVIDLDTEDSPVNQLMMALAGQGPTIVVAAATQVGKARYEELREKPSHFFPYEDDSESRKRLVRLINQALTPWMGRNVSPALQEQDS